MPDITMCLGGDCTQKADCWRYTAPADGWRQSYFAHPPFTIVNNQQVCHYFSKPYTSEEKGEKK